MFAPVGHSTHYHANYVLPYWADSLDKVAIIGRHIFYRIRGAGGAGRVFSQRYAASEPSPQLPPSPALIEQSLETVETGEAASSSSPELPKLEEDRIETLEVGPRPSGGEQSSQLEADLARGTLVLGEAEPASKKKREVATACTTAGAGQLKPLGASDLSAGATKPAC